MLNEWTDRMPGRQAAELWQRRIDEEVARRVAMVEQELRGAIDRQGTMPGFYEAMGHFITLRDKLFPGLPADPAWKLLVTLAQTPEGSAKASVTGIAHGAGVPLTTALRYIGAMELEGILERVAHPADRRQVMIRLTEEGRRKLDSLAEKWTVRLMLLLLVVPLALILYAQGAWAF